MRDIGMYLFSHPDFILFSDGLKIGVGVVAFLFSEKFAWNLTCFFFLKCLMEFMKKVDFFINRI